MDARPSSLQILEIAATIAGTIVGWCSEKDSGSWPTEPPLDRSQQFRDFGISEGGVGGEGRGEAADFGEYRVKRGEGGRRIR